MPYHFGVEYFMQALQMHKFIWNPIPQAVCLISHTEGFGSPDSIVSFASRVMYRDKSWQVTAKICHSITFATLPTVRWFTWGLERLPVTAFTNLENQKVPRRSLTGSL